MVLMKTIILIILINSLKTERQMLNVHWGKSNKNEWQICFFQNESKNIFLQMLLAILTYFPPRLECGRHFLKPILYFRKNLHQNRAPVAHAYNPRYSGRGDQEDCSLKAAQIVNETLSWKVHPKKKAGGVPQGVDPEFKPQ
jgi:hypothetical protein